MRAPTPSKSKYLEISLPKFTFKDTTVNGILAFSLAISTFLVGMLLNKVIYLEKELKDRTSQVAEQPAQPQAEPTEDPTPKQVSIDDDAVLGEENAKVTIIEFSDYECPFCKRYFDQTYEQVKKEYVEKGLAKMVFRDLPLSFHANAHKQAQAAECAREQGGDDVYFKYHDEIFTRTTSNGTGLALDQLAVISNEIGINGVTLQTCLDSDKFKDEVDKDLADAGAIGATGTPTFFIGKSTDNGIITGTKLVGAQPFSEFKRVIDLELEK